jgi:sugar phosphate isomerase/epimerase
VEPARVDSDLSSTVEAVRATGLEVPMITTEITAAATPYAGAILKTASQLGIRHYRWGGLTYQPHKGIAEQLNAFKPRMKALADLNEQHRICGMYHTHSGPGLVGAPIWDLWTIFQGLDPRWIGINYDIGHATVEGGYGGWIDSSRLVRNCMSGIALKENRFSGPVQLHFEYPGLGGAENGDRTLRIPKPELIAAMRRDLSRVQTLMRAQGLI